MLENLDLSQTSGEQGARICVQTLADDRIEGDETFYLVLDNPEGTAFPEQAAELTAQRTHHGCY